MNIRVSMEGFKDEGVSGGAREQGMGAVGRRGGAGVGGVGVGERG